MIKQKTYSEKLRDPRWQKKRLEVMQRDNFVCRWCLMGDKTLNVHHLKYSGNPWDAPLEHLITICEDCHKIEHEHRSAEEQKLLGLLKTKAYNAEDVSLICYAIENACEESPWLITHIISDLLTKPDQFQKSVDDFFHLK